MAAARSRRRDKQHVELVQKNEALQKEISDLETAYQLHQRMVLEDENSVPGVLRKEIGGSRWEHGGAGKLTTYKSNRDLKPAVPHKNQNLSARKVPSSQQNGTSSSGHQGPVNGVNRRVSLMGDGGDRLEAPSANIEKDRLIDMKTRVLKKAGSKVIRRESWASTNDNNIRRKSCLEKETNVESGSVPSKTVRKVKRSNSAKRDTGASSYLDKQEISSKVEEQLCTGLQSNSHMRGSETRKSVGRRSRLDLYQSTEKDTGMDNSSIIVDDVEDRYLLNGAASNRSVDSVTQNGHRKSVELAKKDATYTPRKLTKAVESIDRPSSARLFQTQPKDPTDILIDTKNGQVRIKPSSDGINNDEEDFNDSRVTIRPGSVNKSVDGSKMPCSVVDDNLSCSPPDEVRDIFGLNSIDPNFRTVSQQPQSSASPFAAAKNCNTEVEFWLRGLGLPDVNKYVALFADNDIDLLDLEFMSASQLHDMGISSIGVLDKILKGVSDMRTGAGPLTAEACRSRRKGLNPASIAWEAVDDTDPKRTFNASSKSKSVTKSCHNETFVRRSSDDLLSRRSADLSSLRSDRGSVRCSSAMSNVSESMEAVSSSRFAASTKSSSAKVVERRPPSAKVVVRNGKGNQSINKNLNSTRTVSQSPVTVRRSNSTASEKQSAKLASLDTKPSKGVLLRPRSASVTRDSGKGTKKVSKEEDKEVKGQRTRFRSRSVDAVKRKALEGVQAAARKYETLQQRTRDQDRQYGGGDERSRNRRDQMAARHLQREKGKEQHYSGETSGSSEEDGGQGGILIQTQGTNDGQNMENLVTINVLSQNPSGSDPDRSPREVKDKTSVIHQRGDLRHSLRRVEPMRRPQKNSVKPAEVPLELDLPVLSTYQVGGKDFDKTPSESESGYRTDGSASYSQIEERVLDIQQQIKRLKARASTGDEMTLTLVRDLQSQLVHFEKQLLDREQGPQSGPSRDQGIQPRHKREKAAKSRPTKEHGAHSGTSRRQSASPGFKVQDQQSHSEPWEMSVPHSGGRGEHSADRGGHSGGREEHSDTSQISDVRGILTPIAKPSPRRPFSGGVSEASPTKPGTPGIGSTRTFKPISMETKMADNPQQYQKINRTEEEDSESVEDGVRMSKKELLDEIKKEKQQHHRQIRQLQTELKRIRHTDPVSSLELNSGDIVYKEEDVIGEGTFSQVFKGEYQGSEVAVKRLKVPLLSQDRNYFAAEVSLLKELRHPRVVLLMGVCTNSKLPLMVLEFMSRGNLFNYLHNPNNEPLDHALYYQVAKDIASGMNYLHSHRPEVLHLDLKSMNVLLCQSLRAKIADFGFSKLRHDVSQKATRKVKARTPQGSPVWMGPELLDKGEVTGKADVYSFGIILWEMLTRKIPYGDCSLFQVLERVRKNHRPEIPTSTPATLAKFISRCWDPNPAKRPQFKDVIQSLEQMAFPPAWRDLFVEAGIPDAALQNIQSTRTIINLVANTLDSSESVKLQNFMIPQNMDSLADGGAREVPSADCIVTRQDCQNSQRDAGTEVGAGTQDDWECETISTLSGKSTGTVKELSLKNLRESSDYDMDSREDSDSSSVLSSDVETIIESPSHDDGKAKHKMDVFIPNLELSLRTAREEFKAEREKIDKISDWFSISLDDRSSRSDLGTIHNTSVRELPGNLSIQMSTNRSSRSSTPTSFRDGVCNNITLNESARSKRRNKTRDLSLYTEEQLMRESVDNRRPPSPSKKKSVTQKLLDSSRSSQTSSVSDMERSNSARSTVSNAASLMSDIERANSARSTVSNSVSSMSEMERTNSARSTVSNSASLMSDIERANSARSTVSNSASSAVSSETVIHVPKNKASGDRSKSAVDLPRELNVDSEEKKSNAGILSFDDSRPVDPFVRSVRPIRSSDIMSNRSSRTTNTVDSSMDSFFGISLNDRNNSAAIPYGDKDVVRQGVTGKGATSHRTVENVLSNRNNVDASRDTMLGDSSELTGDNLHNSRLIASSIASMQELLGSERLKPSNIQDSKSPQVSSRESVRTNEPQLSASQVIGEYITEMINTDTSTEELAKKKDACEVKSDKNIEDMKVVVRDMKVYSDHKNKANVINKATSAKEQSKKQEDCVVKPNKNTEDTVVVVRDMKVDNDNKNTKSVTHSNRKETTGESMVEGNEKSDSVRVKLDLSELAKKKTEILDQNTNKTGNTPIPMRKSVDQRKKPAITPRRSKLVSQSLPAVQEGKIASSLPETVTNAVSSKTSDKGSNQTDKKENTDIPKKLKIDNSEKMDKVEMTKPIESDKKGQKGKDVHRKPVIDFGMKEFKQLTEDEQSRKSSLDGVHHEAGNSDIRKSNGVKDEHKVQRKITEEVPKINNGTSNESSSNPIKPKMLSPENNQKSPEIVESSAPKKNVIRVKLRKDPLSKPEAPKRVLPKAPTEATQDELCEDNLRKNAKVLQKKPKAESDGPHHKRKDKKMGKMSDDGIRVQLMKDPLAPSLCRSTASPIPPPPPPPPPPPMPISQSLIAIPSQKKSGSKIGSVSMADELRSRLSDRKSISEGMVGSNRTNSGRPVRKENVIGQGPAAGGVARKMPLLNVESGEPMLMNTSELDDVLVPLQSDGLPSFMVQSMDLRDQKDHLKSISRQHPNQLEEPLCHASKEKLSSIADILKKAVLERRFAMHEDGDSVSQSLDSCATGWSIDTGI